MKILSQKIRSHYPQLTKRQQIVAKYMSEHAEKIVVHTAKELGEITGTSETTVIRLCYTLGFSGYSELQKMMRETVLEQRKSPLNKYRSATGALANDQQLAKHTILEDAAYLEKLAESIDEESMQAIIKKIIESENRFVVGFRSSHAPASWLAFSMNVVLGKTHLYRGDTEDAIYLLSQVTDNTLVIAFSLPRYAAETVAFVKAAKKKGAAILAITDNELSPVGIYADYLLKVETPAPSALKGMPVIFSLLNVLVNGIAVAEWEGVQNRLQEYETISQDFFPFFDPQD
jgi:DNA-binding MurR/RpiR family transcriptional regulator